MGIHDWHLAINTSIHEMNVFALIIGGMVGAFIILRFKTSKLETTQWAYPLLLASFPLYYVLFAIYANDWQAFLCEILVGAMFFFFAFSAYKSKQKLAVLLVGLGSMFHGIYDVYHDILFINTGTPDGWAAFCGVVDVMLGTYLIGLAFSLRYLQPHSVVNQDK